MPDISLSRAIRGHWLSIAVLTIIGVALAALITFLVPKSYEAETLVYISSQGTSDSSATSAYQGGLLSEQRVTSYVGLITSARMAQDVSAQLGGAVSERDVQDSLTASSPTDSVVITISARSTSPEQAAAIATAAGVVFPRLVSELEQPLDPRALPSVGARVVQQPAVPDSAVSPNAPLNIAVGLVLGLLAGVAVAVARTTLDTSVRSVDRLGELTGRPGLGEVLSRRDAASIPLVVDAEPWSPSAEMYREIRTNLQFAQVEGKATALCVTSALPAEGKSTFTANLALALAALGSKVLLVDCDLRRPRVTDFFGVDRAVGLTSVLLGRISLAEATQPSGHPGLSLLASGPLPHNPSELLGSEQMRQLIEDARGSYDFLLFDSSPLLPVTDAAMLSRHCDGAVLVVKWGRTTIKQVQQATSALESASVRLVGSVLSLVPGARGGYGGNYAYYGGPHAGTGAGHETSVEGESGGERGGTVPAPTPAPVRRENGRTLVTTGVRPAPQPGPRHADETPRD